jgi:hypothetical protein
MSRARLCERFERLVDEEQLTAILPTPEEGQVVWHDSLNPGPWKWEAISSGTDAWVGIDAYGAFVRGQENVRVGSPRGLFSRTHPFTLYVRWQTTVLGRTGFPGLYPSFSVEFHGQDPQYLDANGNPEHFSVDVNAVLYGPEWVPVSSYPRINLAGYSGVLYNSDDFPWGEHDWAEGTWYWFAIEVVPGQSINVRLWQDCTEGTETIVLSNDGIEDTIPVPLLIDQIELLFGLGNGATATDKIRIGFIGIEHECPYFRDYLDPEQDLLSFKPVGWGGNTGQTPSTPEGLTDGGGNPWGGVNAIWPAGVYGAGDWVRDLIVDLGETTTLTHLTIGTYGGCGWIMGDYANIYCAIAMSGSNAWPGNQENRGTWVRSSMDIWGSTDGDWATWVANQGTPLVGRYLFIRYGIILGGLAYLGGLTLYGALARRATPCSPNP